MNEPVDKKPPEHSHRCPRCGYVWTHAWTFKADPKAHSCPRCSAMQFVRTTEGYYGELPE
jgi:uncharacterized C2H2 Zn-finger protein